MSAPPFIVKASALRGSRAEAGSRLQVVPTPGSTPPRPGAPPGVAFASPKDMPETITAIPSRSSLPNQSQAARRVSSAERARELARSAREQHPLKSTQTLERHQTTQARLPRISTLLLRIQSEYCEMPGLKLTEAQARRLWDLDGDTCRLVLTTLLDQRFLKCTASGMYVRATG